MSDQEPIPQRWLILFGLAVTFFLGGFDITALNLALVRIQEDLTLTLSGTGWVINGYMMAFGSFLISSGRLTDIFGNKRFFLIGSVIFGLMSVAGGLAEYGWVLVGARMIQGFSVALMWPAITAMAFNLFPKNEIAFAMGILMAFVGFGLAGGPLISGILIEFLSWRWVFFLNVPILLTSFLIVLFFYPGKLDILQKQKIDFLSILFLAAFCFSFIYSLDRIGKLGITNVHSLAWSASTLGLFWLFIAREDSLSEPLIERAKLKNGPFIAGVFLRAFGTLSFFTILFLTGYALQHIAMVSSLVAALYFLPFTLTTGIVSAFAGYLARFFSVRKIMFLGLIGLSIGLLSYAFATLFSLKFSVLFFPLFLSGLSYGFFLPSSNMYTLQNLPRGSYGAGSGILYTIIMFAGSTAVIIASSFMRTPGKELAIKLMEEAQVPLSEMKINLVSLVMRGIVTIPDAMAEFTEHTKEVYQAIKEGFLYAMRLDFLACAALLIIAVALSLILEKRFSTV